MRLAISIIIHHKLDFFELQLRNIRNYYPVALILVHVNYAHGELHASDIERLSQVYNFIINPVSFPVQWVSAVHFSALVSNLRLLYTIPDWDSWIYLSGNELFLKGGLEQLYSEEPCVWDYHHGKVTNYIRDEIGTRYDYGLQKFGYNEHTFITGWGNGRFFNRKAAGELLEVLNEFWPGYEYPAEISGHSLYAMDDIVFPTIMKHLESLGKIKIILDVRISTWISHIGVEEGHIVKHVIMDINDPYVKQITSSYN